MDKFDRLIEAYADRYQEPGHNFQRQMLFDFSEHHLFLRHLEDCCVGPFPEEEVINPGV